MEYVIDCAEWSKERVVEIFFGLPEHTYTKIVLYTEEDEKTSKKFWENCMARPPFLNFVP